MKDNIRESNFELLRIIAMFFIVLFHFIVPTGGNLINSTSGFTQIFFQFIAILMVVHVNSFLLLTGYFQHDKKFKLKKVFDLVLMAWMYKVVIGLAFYFFSSNTYETFELVMILSPLELNNLWFLILYLELYILSPYINIVINKLNQKDHRKLIIILMIIFSIIPTITNQRTFTSNGFTIIHFVVMYIIGAYLSKYPLKENIHFKNFSNRKTRWILIAISLFMGIFNFLLYRFAINSLVPARGSIINEIGNTIMKATFYYEYPTIIIQSVAFFLIFETFKFKSKIINKISSSVFAVYVITETIYMRDYMYARMVILKYYEAFNGTIIPKVLLYSVIIFIVCIVIELIRKLFIKLICKLYKGIFKTHKNL